MRMTMNQLTLRSLLIALAVPAIALLASSGTTLGGLELASMEARFDIRGPTEAPRDVVVVAIDSGTIDTYQPNWRRETPAGPLPLDRALLARFLRVADRAGARAVVLSLYFQAFNQRASSSDRQFLEAIGDLDGRVAAGIRCPEESDIGKSQARLGSSAAIEARGGEVGSLCILDDRKVRQAPLEIAKTEGLIVAAARAAGTEVPEDAFYPDLRVGDSSERFAWIDFYGPRGATETIPLDVVLEQATDRELRKALSERVVVLGWTDGSGRGTDELDTFAPGNDRIFKPEIWAQAVSTMLQDFPLRQTGAAVNLLLVLMFGLAVPLVAIFSRPRFWVALLPILLIALALSTQLLFDAGWIIEFVPPLLALTLSGVSAGLISYLKKTEEIRSLRIRFAEEDQTAVGQVIGGATVGARPAPEVIIPGYRILDLLGRGGSGTVYRATTAAGQRVALKVIRPVMASDPAVRAQFERELEISRRFRHPHAVEILDGGESDGIFFTVAQLASGGDLDARVRDFGPMTADQVLEVGKSVGDCLSAAHDEGIIHRDVKPSNIYIDGSTYLLGDFGIARIKGESDDSEPATGAPGTIAYAAPEQLDEAGSADRVVSESMDIYSLAATLFTLLTGRPPFLTQSVPGTIAAKSAGSDPGLESPSLPFGKALARALDPDPGERPATIEEFLRELKDSTPE